MTNKPDCSQHRKDIAGVSDMKVLAGMIGDLHYETLAELLHRLYTKLHEDSKIDAKGGRFELSKHLDEAAEKIHHSAIEITLAWQICKPFMSSSEPDVQECDATEADSSNAVETQNKRPKLPAIGYGEPGHKEAMLEYEKEMEKYLESTKADWRQKLAEAFYRDSYEDFDTRERSIAEWMAENY